jgi:hypothetical protein
VADILQFRSAIVIGEDVRCQETESPLPVIEQLLQSMQAVDGALTAIRKHLIEEDIRSSGGGSLE